MTLFVVGSRSGNLGDAGDISSIIEVDIGVDFFFMQKFGLSETKTANLLLSFN
jgi:hypothetical protein